MIAGGDHSLIPVDRRAGGVVCRELPLIRQFRLLRAVIATFPPGGRLWVQGRLLGLYRLLMSLRGARYGRRGNLPVPSSIQVAGRWMVRFCPAFVRDFPQVRFRQEIPTAPLGPRNGRFLCGFGQHHVPGCCNGASWRRPPPHKGYGGRHYIEVGANSLWYDCHRQSY